MSRYMGLFEKYLVVAEKSADITLRMWYQHQMMLDQLTHGENYNKLVADVGDYVINHISATVDVKDIVNAIKEINDEINKIGE